jgi:hypothetical protein
LFVSSPNDDGLEAKGLFDLGGEGRQELRTAHNLCPEPGDDAHLTWRITWTIYFHPKLGSWSKSRSEPNTEARLGDTKKIFLSFWDNIEV